MVKIGGCPTGELKPARLTSLTLLSYLYIIHELAGLIIELYARLALLFRPIYYQSTHVVLRLGRIIILP